MMRFLVFEDQQSAQAVSTQIFQFGAQVAQGAGYQIDHGKILARRNGQPDPAAQSQGWDTPRKRADGAWIIAHPEQHSLASDANVLALLMTALGTQRVEVQDATWWPDPDPEEPQTP